MEMASSADIIFSLWFLLKIFLGTTLSPWIVTLDALEAFACDAPKQVNTFLIASVSSPFLHQNFLFSGSVLHYILSDFRSQSHYRI